MSTTLNLSAHDERPSSFEPKLSPQYLEAVNAALFILRYDDQKFYRVFGITVIVVALLFPIAFLSPVVLSAGVLWKGWQTLKTLSKEGQEDEDWQVSKKRALIGTITSGVGLAFSLLFTALAIIGLIMISLGMIPAK